jgi:hypothetical protein
MLITFVNTQFAPHILSIGEAEKSKHGPATSFVKEVISLDMHKQDWFSY